MHQGSVLSQFPFRVMSLNRQLMLLCEMLYSDYIVWISEAIEGIIGKSRQWNKACGSSGFEIDPEKIIVMFSGDMMRNGFHVV